MKAIVDKDVCIGCGLCMEEYPEIFMMGNDGKVEAVDEELSGEDQEKAYDAVQLCPVDAISVSK